MVEIVAIAEAGPLLAQAALERTILGGGVAIFPADGLYGLACDPMNATAIERIHALKGRDDGKPSAVMYFSPLAMRELIATLDSKARLAVGALLPGPVTLVVANPAHRYPLACREDRERLGIRLIDGPLGGTSVPIFQTSANLSGEPAPAAFEDIPSAIVDGVDLAIDGGRLTGEPSTVVDVTGDEPRILREGALAAAEISNRLGSLSSDA
jgi:L-threonylcarbamoyladenylate synthase